MSATGQLRTSLHLIELVCFVPKADIPLGLFPVPEAAYNATMPARSAHI